MKKLSFLLLLIAVPAHALDGSVQIGPVTSQGVSERLAVSRQIRSWLNVSVGLLVTSGGPILDVTPMIQTPGRLFSHAGIGLGYNGVHSPEQSQGVIFREVAGVGYKVTQNVTVTVDVVHYSNGGAYNPIFGTDRNQGYSGVLLGIGQKF